MIIKKLFDMLPFEVRNFYVYTLKGFSIIKALYIFFVTIFSVLFSLFLIGLENYGSLDWILLKWVSYSFLTAWFFSVLVQMEQRNKINYKNKIEVGGITYKF